MNVCLRHEERSVGSLNRVLHEELSRVYSCTWVGWMVSGAPKVQAKSVVSSLDRVQRIQPCMCSGIIPG